MSSLCVAGLLSENPLIVPPDWFVRHMIIHILRWAWPDLHLPDIAIKRRVGPLSSSHCATRFLCVQVSENLSSPTIIFNSSANEKTACFWVVWLRLSFNLRHFQSHQLERGLGAQTAAWIYNSPSLHRYVEQGWQSCQAVCWELFLTDMNWTKFLEEQSRSVLL